MMKLTHTFKVWHPRDGLPSVYTETEFTFFTPVTRTWARKCVEKDEGFVIEKIPRKRAVRVKYHKPQKNMMDRRKIR